MAIASNKPAQFSAQLLDGFGIGRHFTFVGGPDLGFEPKPAPGMVLAALAALGVDPRTAFAEERFHHSHEAVVRAVVAGQRAATVRVLQEYTRLKVKSAPVPGTPAELSWHQRAWRSSACLRPGLRLDEYGSG